MSKNIRVKKNITLPRDVVEWAEEAVKGGKYAGVRSLSGLIEYLLKKEMEKRFRVGSEGITIDKRKVEVIEK